MNWFKEIMAANINSRVFTDTDGLKYLGLFGNGTYESRSQLFQAGFRWDDKNRIWKSQYDQIPNNPIALSLLQSFGIPFKTPQQPITQPINSPSPAVNNPTAVPQQTGGNWFNKNVQPGAPTWVLSKRISDNAPVVVTKSIDGNQWIWLDRSGNEGVFPASNIKNLVKSIRDTQGKPLTGTDPVALFTFFDNEQPEDQRIIEEQKVEEENIVPGRMPESRMSPYNKAIENTFLQTNDSIVINALAGTGKTTQLRHLASFKDPSARWLYLVFNKKNQVEASTGDGAFPNGVEVKTSHSFLGELLNTNAQKSVAPATDIWNQKGERINAILDEIMEEDNIFPRQVRFAAKRTIKRLASLSKAYAIDPQDAKAASLIESIIKQYQIDTDLSTERHTSNVNWANRLIDKTLDVLHYCLPNNAINPDFQGFRDQDDTLWYTALNPNLIWPKYDVVLADEVQDFNKCQMKMIENLLKAQSRVVAVGDPNQAIYMFRGADAKAFDNIQTTIQGTAQASKLHELPANYRCGTAIIDFVNQNTHVKNLVAGAKHTGSVTNGTMYDEALGNLFNEWKQGNKLKDQTAFISRTNRPLVDAALELMKNDMEFAIIGRDFSQELVGFVEMITGKGRFAKNIPISGFTREIDRFMTDVEQKWAGKLSKSDELKEMQDISASISHIVEHLRGTNFIDRRLNFVIRDTNSFISYLKQRFAGINIDTVEGAGVLKKKDPASFITLTSAHRSKGLEFNRVFILHNELFPHPKAKSEEELGQEANAKYIAYTRAKNELHILKHPKQ